MSVPSVYNTGKFTLIPSAFYSKENRRSLLEEVVKLSDAEEVSSIECEEEGAVLLFAHPKNTTCRPEMITLLETARSIKDHLKIVACLRDGLLSLLIEQGSEPLLCNSFTYGDFPTALYWIFLCLKSLQLNAEVSAIHFCHTHLSKDERITLLTYFKAVEEH